MEAAIRLSPHDPLLVIWHAALGWAAMSQERYDEAIAYEKKALDESRDFADTYVILASACGHAGRIDEAAAALEEYQKHLPGLTVNDPRLIRPFKKPADQARFLEGLRKAGLPGG
jgi:pentatricopeptide repeat protein